MKNRRSGWRYPYEERRDSGREWRVRSSNQREETAAHHHQHNAFRGDLVDEGRAVHGTGWGDIGDTPSSGRAVHGTGWGDFGEAPSSGRAVHGTGWGDFGDAPSSGRAVHGSGWGDSERIGHAASYTAPSNRRVDIKETERKCDDGWGISPVDNPVSADVTSAWEALATANLSDWSKPPQIESVEHWDDTGAKETWDSVTTGRSPVNNPDLYLDRNIDWNFRIPTDLLAFVDDRCRHRKASPPRPGSPVLLGLETLVQNSGDTAQPPPRNGNMRKKSMENPQQGGGGSGSWGDSKPGQRRTKQDVNERAVPGEKQKSVVRDDYIDRGRKRRGDKDEHHRKPRFRGAHRY